MYRDFHSYHPLQMQMGSAYTSPGNMSSQDFDICVTLTSTRDRHDIRYLTLMPGRSCPIGRASKTKGNMYHASDTNGLFNSPVVSRQHAELRAHPWSPSGEQVTIIDYGSMHGTKVNNKLLEKGRSMALRNGDILQFGDKVTRGNDSHDGVMVTYQRVSGNDSQTLRQNQSQSQASIVKPIEVPDYSDDEMSYVSDEEDELHDSSSAKTTPEHQKARFGSQDNPIELEPASQAFVIDLTDDEKASSLPQPAAYTSPESISEPPTNNISLPPIFDSNKVVEDSVDKDNSFYEAYRPRNLSEMVTSSNRAIMRANGNNASVHQLGLAGVLNQDEDGISSVSSESENGDWSDEFDAEDNNNESDEDAQIDDQAEDIAREDERIDDRGDDDDDRLYDPDDYEPRKQASPELGSDTGFIGALSTAPGPINHSVGLENEISPVVLQPPSASQPVSLHQTFPGSRDTIHGFGASNVSRSATTNHGADTMNTMRPIQYAGEGQWKPYSFVQGSSGLSNHSNHILNPAPTTTLPNTNSLSRPNFISQPPPPSFGALPPPVPMRPYGFGMTSYECGLSPYGVLPPPPLPSRPSITQPSRRTHPYPPYNDFVTNSNRATNPVLSTPTMNTAEASKPEEHKPKESEKNKISIDELVENDDIILDDYAWSSPKSSVGTGTKRKIDDLSKGVIGQAQDMITEAEAFVNAASQSVNKATSAVSIADKTTTEEPASRRRRTSSHDDVSTAIAIPTAEVQDVQKVLALSNSFKNVAKMAGGAVIGSVATMAFLCSPLAEKALEYLA